MTKLNKVNELQKIIWVVINTNGISEAEKIGKAALKQRLCACYDLIPRIKSEYYWPPKSKKFEATKGPILILETLPTRYQKIVTIVKSLHSDKVPMIGQLMIEKVNPDFYNWLRREIK